MKIQLTDKEVVEAISFWLRGTKGLTIDLKNMDWHQDGWTSDGFTAPVLTEETDEVPHPQVD